LLQVQAYFAHEHLGYVNINDSEVTTEQKNNMRDKAAAYVESECATGTACFARAVVYVYISLTSKRIRISRRPFTISLMFVHLLMQPCHANSTSSAKTSVSLINNPALTLSHSLASCSAP
jgi:hypothetical protein